MSLPTLYTAGWDHMGTNRHRFGWVNASYVYGLTIVNTYMKRALGVLTPWELFHSATEQADEAVL